MLLTRTHAHTHRNKQTNKHTTLALANGDEAQMYEFSVTPTLHKKYRITSSEAFT
jgi:hypothetical protein